MSMYNMYDYVAYGTRIPSDCKLCMDLKPSSDYEVHVGCVRESVGGGQKTSLDRADGGTCD